MTETADINPKLTENNKLYIIKECVECGRKKSKLAKKNEII